MSDRFRGTGSPLSQRGFDAALTKLGGQSDIALLWSILSVETRGFGYLRDMRPKILFERHVFHQRTGGRFSAAHPDISNPKRGGYSGGAAEYARLARAMALSEKAALESTSWGLGQVMGFNAASLDYADAKDMVEQFKAGEDAQLDGCARFIIKNGALRTALQRCDWARVAFYYNGSHYADNNYDAKLAEAYQSYTRMPPRIDVRTGQARLYYAGFDPKGIDGVLGHTTIAALRKFQESRALKQTGTFDEATSNALLAAAGI